jgi:hypothetical protein
MGCLAWCRVWRTEVDGGAQIVKIPWAWDGAWSKARFDKVAPEDIRVMYPHNYGNNTSK